MVFKIGDKVEVIAPEGSYKGAVGMFGTVTIVVPSAVGVVHDKPMGGHNLKGNCRYGYGLWYHKPEYQLRPRTYAPTPTCMPTPTGQFQKGDRVRIIKSYNSRWWHGVVGDTGTVKGVRKGTHSIIQVEHDRCISGHSCNGQTRMDYGWEYHPEHLEKIEEEPTAELHGWPGNILRKSSNNHSSKPSDGIQWEIDKL